MSVIYTYTKSSINKERLLSEFNRLSFSSLFEEYRYTGTQLSAYFSQSLTQTQKNEVDALVANHVVNPTKKAESSGSTTGNNDVYPYDQKVSFTETLESGDYYINWYYEYNCDSSSKKFLGLVRYDGVDISEVVSENKDTMNYIPCSGRIPVTLTDGSHTFEIRFGINRDSRSVKIRKAIIYIEEK